MYNVMLRCLGCSTACYFEPTDSKRESYYYVAIAGPQANSLRQRTGSGRRYGSIADTHLTFC